MKFGGWCPRTIKGRLSKNPAGGRWETTSRRMFYRVISRCKCTKSGFSQNTAATDVPHDSRDLCVRFSEALGVRDLKSPCMVVIAELPILRFWDKDRVGLFILPIDFDLYQFISRIDEARCQKQARYHFRFVHYVVQSRSFMARSFMRAACSSTVSFFGLRVSH